MLQAALSDFNAFMAEALPAAGLLPALTRSCAQGSAEGS